MRIQQITKPPDIGKEITFRSKYDLKPGGYRWIQYNGYRVLIRILKLLQYRTWRSNNGLGERRYSHIFSARVVNPKKIVPILDYSETIQYADSNTEYITKLKYPPYNH